MNQRSIPDEYVGDGVYASFDGYHIVLDLRAQDSMTRIALEPPVMRALKEFERRCQAAVQARHEEQERQERAADAKQRADLRALKLREIVSRLEQHLQCNCDLDNWEPELNTGHSHVCRIHKHATRTML